MSQKQPNILLDYTVPVTFKRSSDGKVLFIDGMAIGDTVNSNLWQVPTEELDYFVFNSQSSQIRVDHGDRVEDVKGIVNVLRVPTLASDGRMEVQFKGEVSGDEELLAKIEKEYVNCVSPRVTGEMYCSACGSASRDGQMNLVHMCRGAWEIVRKPRLIELSIVSKGAYEYAKFKPVGFAAAMIVNLQSVIGKALIAKAKPSCTRCAGALSFDCLGCTSQVHSHEGANHNGEKSELLASSEASIHI